MKLIKPTVTYWPQESNTLAGIKKMIEKCTRITRQTQHLQTEDSYIRLVDTLIKLKHFRALEFGTVYLAIPSSIADVKEKFPKLQELLLDNHWTRYTRENNIYYITTNYRVIIENGLEEILKYISEPTEYHKKRYCFNFVIERSILDEFRTHISLSHMAESTRSSRNIAFIIPYYNPALEEKYQLKEKDYTEKEINAMESDVVFEDSYPILKTYLEAERSYNKLIQKGYKRDEARKILPLGIKSELVSCGYLEDWKHFLKLRDVKLGAKGVHKDAAYAAHRVKVLLDKVS